MPQLHPLPEPSYVLEVDALFLSSARRHLRHTRPAMTKIATLHRRLDRLQEQMDDAKACDDYDTQESLAHQLEGAYAELTAAYTPSLRHCAQANVLAAIAVEAHLNRHALRLRLDSKSRERLLWLPVEKKTQELLDRNGAPRFRENQRPFSELTKLMKRRHALVHYRPRRLGWPDTRAPRIPQKLGLDRFCLQHQ